MYIHIYVYSYICIFIYIYIYTHIHSASGSIGGDAKRVCVCMCVCMCVYSASGSISGEAVAKVKCLRTRWPRVFFCCVLLFFKLWQKSSAYGPGGHGFFFVKKNYSTCSTYTLFFYNIV